jgi:hypothetical protein
MSNFVAIYDACVLYPAALRDLLTRRPDIPREMLERTRDLMDANVPDCLISGYEGLEPELTLPDENDCHVLAAAILAKAGTIVTYNLTDFPESVLAPLGITAQHPDQFIEHAFDLHPASVIKAVAGHRRSLLNPPLGVEELFDCYLRQGLATTVALLRPNTELL